MLQNVIESDLISHNQSEFKPGYSCNNQLLYFTDEIYISFGEGYETRGVFLDISKTFDKISHEGLLHKLNENGLSGNLLNITSRKAKNGQYSSWAGTETGTAQGSILEPFFFSNIYK